MKKKVRILCIAAIVIVVAGASIYLYHQPLSAGSLFSDDCRYVTYYYKAYPTAEASETAPCMCQVNVGKDISILKSVKLWVSNADYPQAFTAHF